MFINGYMDLYSRTQVSNFVHLKIAALLKILITVKLFISKLNYSKFYYPKTYEQRFKITLNHEDIHATGRTFNISRYFTKLFIPFGCLNK
jgi:hypothetical protein